MSNLKYVISACLCGEATRYDGKVKPADPALCALVGRGEAVLVCPECMGGLPTPRPPAEICGERVVNTEGVDVTAQYRRGAELTLEICRKHGITNAILKQNSPSCGSCAVYDGTFSRTLVAGRGITAALLEEHGIAVYDETNWQEKEGASG